MNTPPRPRPAAAPAYYLGRPATMWLTALNRRAAGTASHPSPRPELRSSLQAA